MRTYKTYRIESNARGDYAVMLHNPERIYQARNLEAVKKAIDADIKAAKAGKDC